MDSKSPLSERELPLIRKDLLRNGIRPANFTKLMKVKDIYKKGTYNIVGFDTESVIGFENAHQLYTTQITYKPNYYESFKTDVRVYPVKGIERLNDFPQYSLIFAHNLEFDLTNILGDDLKVFANKGKLGGWSGFFCFGQGRLAHFQNKKLKKSLRFIDTMNYFKGNLETVAKEELPKSFQKLDKPIFLGNREPNESERESFIKYAIRDSEICYLLGYNVYANYYKTAGTFAYTTSGLAVKSFRRHFLTKPFKLPNREDMHFIWNSYNGARFESFARGTCKDVNVYDINSLYPYAATFPMPFSSNNLEYISLDKFEKDKENFVGWVKCSGHYNKEEIYPSIPMRHKKLFFPLEFKDTYLTTYELAEALKEDIEFENIHIRGFYPTQKDIDHPIKDYVNYYYGLKKELDEKKEREGLTDAEKRLRDFYKAMLNHLYGKTAERHKTKNKYGEMINISGKFFNPFVCSLITGKSRAVLHYFIKKYEALSCDTDSVFTYKTMPTSTDLGGFKLEKKGDCVFIRPKLYFVLKDGKVVKHARHSFRLSLDESLKLLKPYLSTDDYNKTMKEKNIGSNIFTYLNKLYDKTDIPYKINKISKYKESVRRNLPFLSDMQVSISLKMKADIRREYFKNLNTMTDLTNENTLSKPVLNPLMVKV